jgi:hypothetical protein
MKKLFITVLFCFFGVTTFAQGAMVIYNNSPYKIKMEIQALRSTGVLNPKFTPATIITIPQATVVGGVLTPATYTFTNFNSTDPATLTSQFTQWTRATLTLGTYTYLNLSKPTTQANYAPLPVAPLFIPPFPIWNQIKFTVYDPITNVAKGSGGIARTLNGYYPTTYPNSLPGGVTPGGPVGGSFTGTWQLLPPAFNNGTIVTFAGIGAP